MSFGAKPAILNAVRAEAFAIVSVSTGRSGTSYDVWPWPKPRIDRRFCAEFARTLVAHHHHGSRAVRDKTDIVAPQRLDDERRLHVFVERERQAQGGMRIRGAMIAHRDRDFAELLRFGAVLRHVALHRHGVAGRDAEPAVGGVVTPGLLVGLARAGLGIVRKRHERYVALAGVD